MSSIFGYVRRTAAAPGEADLVRMDQALAGPFNKEAGRTVQGQAGLGARAWTIHDKAGAAGTDSGIRIDGSIVFAATGRVDNRRTLLPQLQRSGCLPPDGDDLDLLFAAYRQWGIDGLDRIAGCYAFAVWHADARRLVLVRSAPVAPPLYYHQGGDGLFAFATMPRGLFALPGLTRRLDRRILAMNLIRLSGPDEATLYQDVRRLPTGCLLVRQGDAPPVLEPWWRLGPGAPSPADDDAEGFATALRDLMAQVVVEQMPETGPTAMLLSGGLDSTAIAALAASSRPDRALIGFTHVPRPDAGGTVPAGWNLDESDHVKAIAALHPNLDSRLLPPSMGYFLDGADAITRAQERHFSNIGNLAWMSAAADEARESGVRVMLTGTQGNLTASRNGGPPLVVALLERRWDSIARHLSLHAALSAGLLLLPDVLRRWQQGLRGHPFAAIRKPWRHFSAINPAFAKTQDIDDLGREWLETYLPRSPVDERPTLLHHLRRQDLGLTDHAFTSLHGVEYRHPLADIRIARFCLSAPNGLFHADGQPRSAIRAALRGLLPDSVLSNRLRGLQGGDVLLRMRSHPNNLAADLDRLEGSALGREILDLPRMRAAVPRLSDMDGAAVPILASLLVFGLSMGRFLCWLEDEGVQ